MTERTLTAKIPGTGLKYISPFGPKPKGGGKIKSRTTGAGRK